MSDDILNVEGSFKVISDAYADGSMDFSGQETETFDASAHTTPFRVRDEDDDVLTGVTADDQDSLDGLRRWAEAEVMVSDEHVLEVQRNGAWEVVSEATA